MAEQSNKRYTINVSGAISYVTDPVSQQVKFSINPSILIPELLSEPGFKKGITEVIISELLKSSDRVEVGGNSLEELIDNLIIKQLPTLIASGETPPDENTIRNNPNAYIYIQYDATEGDA